MMRLSFSKLSCRALVAGAVSALLSVLPAAADFQLLDDFQSSATGDVRDDSASLWTAHSTSLFSVLEEGENRFLGYAYDNGHRAGTRALPGEWQIQAGEAATVFLQFRSGVLTPGSDQAAHFGLTHAVDTSANLPEAGFRVEVRLRPAETAERVALEVRDGAEWRRLATVAQGIWHNLWLVVDRTSGDRFRVYLNGGSEAATSADLLGYDDGGTRVTEFAFRDNGAAGDLLDGFTAHGFAAGNRTMHLDNLWMDKGGENLGFVGSDFNGWQFAFAPMSAPVNLSFGAGGETGENLLRNRAGDFTAQGDAVRLTGTGASPESSTALVAVEDYAAWQDFTVEAEVTLRQFWANGEFGAGLAVLGGPHTPVDAPFNASGDAGFYGLVWYPALDLETSVLRIREGFGGDILAEVPWTGRHPSQANGGEVGQRYQLRADGVYDESGILHLTFQMTDVDNVVQSVSAEIVGAHSGNLFGVGGRLMEDSFGDHPQFDYHSLSIALGEAPSGPADPIVTRPFSMAFGSGSGRDAGDNLRQNHPDDWALEESALRLSGSGGDYHASVSSSLVFNYEEGEAFSLRLRASPQNLAAGPDDNRVGLVFLGDADASVFDPEDDATYYSFQLIPNAAAGASIAVREGMNGPVLAQTFFGDLSKPPATAAGTVYDFVFDGLFMRDGRFVFVGSVTDGSGGFARVLGEIDEPVAGKRFGFGAWHRAAGDPVWDFAEFAMGDPSDQLRVDAAYSDNDQVTGKAVQSSVLGYSIDSGSGYVGSEGGASSRRHHNPVIGFVLPDVPREKLVRFELAIHRADGRENHDVDLYGLLPANPAAVGADLWWEGPELDARTDLVGAVWEAFIPENSLDDGVYTQDVTNFLLGFYDENGRTQEKVFFRLSPGVSVAVGDLARTDIVSAKGLETSPRLSFYAYPPLAPDPFVEAIFDFAFGEGEGRGGLESFALSVPDEWELTEESARLSTDSANLHNSISTTRIIDLGAGTSFGMRTRMTLGALGSDPEARAGLVLFGDRDNEVFDATNEESYFTFQWIPDVATGGSIALRRGMNGAVVAEAETPAGFTASAGMTYDLEFHAVFDDAGDLEFVGILRDGNGVEAEVAGTIAGADVGDRNRFGFGARHGGGSVWDFHDFTMIDGWKVEYAAVEAPFSLEFGADGGRDGWGGLLVDRPLDWALLGDAARLAPSSSGSYYSTGGAVEVSNYVPGQDFVLEAEFTLRSASGAIEFQRIGLVLLGERHEPFANPFSAGDEAGYYGPSWYLSNSLRVRVGMNGTEFARENPEPPVPLAFDGVYQMKAEGVHQPNGDLELTFSLTHGGQTHSVTGTRTEPFSGNMFGVGVRTRANEQPVYDIHRLSLTLGEVPVPGGFAAWRSANFTAEELANPAISGAAATPAGDGIPNLVKYAMDLDALTPVASGDLFETTVEGGELRLSYFERTDVNDVVYVVEVSEDLADWETGAEWTEEASRVSAGGNLEDVTVRALLPEGAARGFMRLRVELR